MNRVEAYQKRRKRNPSWGNPYNSPKLFIMSREFAIYSAGWGDCTKYKSLKNEERDE